MPNPPEERTDKDSDKSVNLESTDTAAKEAAHDIGELHHTNEQPVKKSKKPWVIFAIVVLVITGLTAGYFYGLSAVKESYKADQAAEAAKPTHFASSGDLVKQATRNLEGAILDVTSANGLGGTTADNYMAYSTPRYHVDGNKFDNLPVESAGAGYKGDSAVATENYQKLTAFFKNNNFALASSEKDVTAPISWSSELATYKNLSVYKSDDQICMVWHADASGTALAAHVTSLGCSSKASYETAAKALAPLYAAYAKVATNPSSKLLLGFYGSSSKDGAETVTLYQEDPNSGNPYFFKGEYTKVSGSDTWTYKPAA